ncbi:hypothetical protein AiwAL_13990 [Acidiphilium sp. AL]|uniref:DUF3311 domain-containing protein n=1 Tax=Acidiphilium iwatense TaxID=768198 RepID=A0ABS9DZ45_9PROT|nr:MULTISPECIES: hypothetical protein [Acidiphilium]MCF3948034.1 hypothetical protein [Acidiphilium iwatense]MCU4161202.1 hypothetical protein [Acidiphilium sp. AL]
MRLSMFAWLVGLVLIVLLYTVGPAIGFNHATPPILGMPPLYFWFVLVPLLNPVILGAVYLIDRDEGRKEGVIGDGEV